MSDRTIPLDDLSEFIEEQVDLILSPLPEPCRCLEPVLGDEDIARSLFQCRVCRGWLMLEYLRGFAPRHGVE